jgi:hypothetical protein
VEGPLTGEHRDRPYPSVRPAAGDDLLDQGTVRIAAHSGAPTRGLVNRLVRGGLARF